MLKKSANSVRRGVTQSGLAGFGIFHYLVLVCFVGQFFPNSAMIRLANAPAIEPILYLVRGGLIVLGQYLYWMIVGFILVLKLRSHRNRIIVKKQMSSITLFLIFLTYLAIQVVFSSTPDAAFHRSQIFLLYVLPTIITALLFIDTKSILSLRFVFVIYAFVICANMVLNKSGLIGVYLGTETYEIGPRFAISDTLNTSAAMLICTLMIVSSQLLQRTNIWRSILFFSICIFLFYNSLIVGSRGPVISFVIALTLLMFITRRRIVMKTTYLLIALLPLVIVYTLFIQASFSSIVRFENALADVNRESNYRIALDAPATLFGTGVGSFTLHSHDSSTQHYVHNSLLEAYLELGVVGLVLFISMVFIAFKRVIQSYRKSGDEAAQFCLIGLTFYFVWSMFSGHLMGSAGLYLFILLSSWYVPKGIKRAPVHTQAVQNINS